MPDFIPAADVEINLAEEALQQELRSMFEVDTQTYLQSYLHLTQNLTPHRWREDIQEIYRSIHTIKGGAVTVGADAVLATTTQLEDLLSDLRYLQTAPELADGKLSRILAEAGEVVTSSLLLSNHEGQAALQTSLDRLQQLHDQVKQLYLEQVDEHQQLCQDFANQGFDLMVLDLEMAVEQLPEVGGVPGNLADIATQVLAGLAGVGKNLEMGSGWQQLLEPLYQLLLESDAPIWRSRCQTFLPLLKQCALAAGDLSEAAQEALSNANLVTTPPAESPLGADLEMFDLWEADLASTEAPAAPWDLDLPENVEAAQDSAAAALTDDPSGEFDWIVALAEEALTLTEEPGLSETSDPDEENLISLAEPALEESTLWKDGQLLEAALQQFEGSSLPLASPDQGVSDPQDPAMLEPETILADPATPGLTQQASGDTKPDEDLPEWVIEPAAPAMPAPAVAQTPERALAQPASASKLPQIPVPLERLDRSAQTLVDILLSARSAQGRYQSLYQQIANMVQLAEESAGYITQLRALQDDYALMRDLRQTSNQQGPKVETYRNGYTAINRLLENSLRLGELGAEAASIAQQTRQEFEHLDLNIKALQHSIEESRLVSFKSVAFRLRAVVRDLINRMGKPATLIIQGESQTLDAGTVQALEPALLHLIRNAYDHGLDSPQERVQAGKTDDPTLTLSLQRQGNHYLLSLTDNGRGIDRQKISAIAQKKGLPLTDTTSDAQLLAVLCQSGFSSQENVSAVSGRGVGMDVVLHQVRDLGGSLTLTTRLGQGTTFDLKVPVPHLLVPCLVAKAGERTFAIPMDNIQTMQLWDETCEMTPVTENTAAPWRRVSAGEPEPMLPLLQYWQAQYPPASMSAEKMDTLICLRIPNPASSSSSGALWLVIDDLIEELELLINPIPSPLAPPAGLMGTTVLPTGEVIAVIEAQQLATLLLSSAADQLTLAAEAQGSGAVPQASASNLILVVDDAALLRRRLEVSLMNYGYQVHTCRDGLEAWNWLQANGQPGLMITDIEMPQMDGFTLVDHCRKAAMVFPILVSSSRLSEEWSKEALRVGATAYLTKGFSTTELIDRVSALMNPVAS
ncbi:response regulator [Lyngbya confervoides]|uniref:histidine kinase n=1 Tax=Lyngbya confervoides BDU141951 TaxID=1574623 RepID=A0ABD4T8V3_9CYAN|nr:response regulator [Lyngbya confervoides]MCM1984930.1 response regulator [Lyngbya confervoides BDU141951]